MFCTQCGHQLPTDARYCSQCGSPVDAAERGGDETGAVPVAGGPTPDVTTAAIDVGALDDQASVDDVPEFAPGTGMLVVVRGPNAGSRFLLDRDVTTVGRHPDSHVFLDDVTVSRRHSEVERRGDDLAIKDLGSLNGTYVNGERVEDRLLRSGDELQVGRFKLMFVGTSGQQG